MKILIVEDEMEMASGIWTILTREGYQVDVEYDGKAGLRAINKNEYGMVLLDIMLPEIDGLQVLEKVRESGNMIPIILLTAKSQTEDKIIGLDYGADDYLTKPFDAGELMARIRAVVRRRVGSEGAITMQSNKIEAFGMTLFRGTYMLNAGSKSVKLANKEFMLLEYLMVNKGQILTREMLATKAWSDEEDSNYNNLDVYISFLRKKLRFVEAKAQIKTTKNVGYSLEEVIDG